MSKKTITFPARSLNRPAWTQDDLLAFNHKHVFAQKFGSDVRPSILRDYYKKSGGME